VTAPPLRVHGVTKRFGDRTVLAAIDLDVAPGEAVVLLGPNGAGKSTLLGCVVGTVIPDEGTVDIDGRSLHGDPIGARARLRWLPQEVEVPLGLTGRELLGFFADVHGDPSGAARAAERSALGEALERLASTYSVGMRRNLVFSALLPGTAALWVLDEPFAGIDADGRARMLAVLREAQANGAGVLLAAHDRDAPEIAELGARAVPLA